jgi:hypothetical protein
MRVIISGIVAAFAIAVIAGFVLTRVQVPAYEAYSTSSTRLDDPGSNLVGNDWSGNPRLERGGA